MDFDFDFKVNSLKNKTVPGAKNYVFFSILGLSTDHDLLERTRKSLETGIKAANLPTRLGCLHGILYLVQCDNPEVISEVNTHIMPFILDYLQTYLQHYATPHVGVCEGN